MLVGRGGGFEAEVELVLGEGWVARHGALRGTWAPGRLNRFGMQCVLFLTQRRKGARRAQRGCAGGGQ
jgi:hypothetical protein